MKPLAEKAAYSYYGMPYTINTDEYAESAGANFAGFATAKGLSMLKQSPASGLKDNPVPPQAAAPNPFAAGTKIDLRPGPAIKGLMTEDGSYFPVPKGASTTSMRITENGKGVIFEGGSGGANGQVASLRIMGPTKPVGKSPGYPRGYVKYENGQAKPQGVDPNSGQTVPPAQAHHAIEAAE